MQGVPSKASADVILYARLPALIFALRFMNVLIFHLHDMGRYCSPYGYPVPTPHMGTFARGATVFRQAFSAAPTCSPSRAALLTGQTAHQSGMLGLLHRGFDLSDYSRHLGNYLKRNGYETAYAGVQHEFNPDSDQEIPYDRKLESPETCGRRDEQAACAAVEYLEGKGAEKRPFFLWIGMHDPHRPFLESDPAKRNPDYLQPPAPLPDTPETRRDMADYMETVEQADSRFGEVMAALGRNGLREKTLVILTTDHGIAFPEMKCNLTHHGTGVALIVDYPGNPRRGEACDALVSHLDIYPTVCELLGRERPPHLIGNSLKPLLDGKEESIRQDAFAEVNFHAGPSKSLLISNGLGSDSSRDRVQLYDLTFDPQERRNLAENPSYREVRLALEKRLEAWMRQTADPLLVGSVEAPSGARLDARI